ncbi:HAD family phosphatase [Kocuria sp. JC486]|uniref:HAD family hydrolase n=1 Tax=Kocuria sp. JC486 TaxID=1970736 RepID=UPI0014225CA4|nr:HAD family phosphatase [Kocuria sp. JC486]NHU84289.1 HAD family phosphatase [Kocuria sp. JC486]
MATSGPEQGTPGPTASSVEIGSSVGTSLPDALLCDMDGTLVDTEGHWFTAEAALMVDHGVPWSTEDSMHMLGFALPETAAYMRGKGLQLTAEQVGAELESRVLEAIAADLPVRPGALELLVEARSAGVPLALVTNSSSALAGAVSTRLTALAQGHGISEPLFDVTVTGDLGLPAKPDPAPYVFAARRLAALYSEKGRPGATVHNMIAIEDSLTGLRSARAAGAVVVGVPNMAPLSPEAVSVAHVTPESLAGVTLSTLSRWIGEVRHTDAHPKPSDQLGDDGARHR